VQAKIWSLVGSLAAIALGLYLSLNTNFIFYGLVLAGVLYALYDIYKIATHKKTAAKEQATAQRLAEQQAFGAAPPQAVTPQAAPPQAVTPQAVPPQTVTPQAAPPPNVAAPLQVPASAPAQATTATIIVRWYKDKMGMGEMPVVVNGVPAGSLKKGSEQVAYQTNVPYNVIEIGVYKTEVELGPGDTVELVAAGNGIRHGQTRLTKGT
jgi:hypothetical protein